MYCGVGGEALVQLMVRMVLCDCFVVVPSSNEVSVFGMGPRPLDLQNWFMM